MWDKLRMDSCYLWPQASASNNTAWTSNWSTVLIYCIMWQDTTYCDVHHVMHTPVLTWCSGCACWRHAQTVFQFLKPLWASIATYVSVLASRKSITGNDARPPNHRTAYPTPIDMRTRWYHTHPAGLYTHTYVRTQELYLVHVYNSSCNNHFSADSIVL